MARILLVDDEPAVLAALQRVLRQRFAGALQVHAESDALAALARLKRDEFDIVVSDLRMPEIDGVALLALAGALQPECVRLLLTGSADFGSAQRAIQDAGVFRYLTKPWDEAELCAHLQAALLQAASNRPLRLPD